VEIDEFVERIVEFGEEPCVLFAKKMIHFFGEKYLRALNEEDTKMIMAMNKASGWLKMLGSINCMHWTWKNFPAA
jgi:hypothetical protein